MRTITFTRAQWATIADALRVEAAYGCGDTNTAPGELVALAEIIERQCGFTSPEED